MGDVTKGIHWVGGLALSPIYTWQLPNEVIIIMILILQPSKLRLREHCTQSPTAPPDFLSPQSLPCTTSFRPARPPGHGPVDTHTSNSPAPHRHHWSQVQGHSDLIQFLGELIHRFGRLVACRGRDFLGKTFSLIYNKCLLGAGGGGDRL